MNKQQTHRATQIKQGTFASTQIQRGQILAQRWSNSIQWEHFLELTTTTTSTRNNTLRAPFFLFHVTTNVSPPLLVLVIKNMFPD